MGIGEELGKQAICVVCMDDIRPMKFTSIFHDINPSLQVYYKRHTDNDIVSFISSRDNGIQGIILTGSKYRINTPGSPSPDKALLNLGIPVLGICYGFQWLTKVSGGKVCTFSDGRLHNYHKLLSVLDVPRKLYRFTHHDYICKLAKGWKPLIQHESQIWMAIDPKSRHIGIQFHPEKRKASRVFFETWLKYIGRVK